MQRVFFWSLFIQIVLGSVQIACSRVESVEEIRTRLQQVLTVLPVDRLIVAPDCGLGFLPAEIAKEKLCNMVEAAKSLPWDIAGLGLGLGMWTPIVWVLEWKREVLILGEKNYSRWSVLKFDLMFPDNRTLSGIILSW